MRRLVPGYERLRQPPKHGLVAKLMSENVVKGMVGVNALCLPNMHSKRRVSRSLKAQRRMDPNVYRSTEWNFSARGEPATRMRCENRVFVGSW